MSLNILWKSLEKTQLKELDSGRGTSNSISFSDRNSDSNSTRNRHDSDKGIIVLRTGTQGFTDTIRIFDIAY